MWGFAPVLTRLGRDMGFVPFVMTSCVALYAASLLIDRPNSIGGVLDLLSPTATGLFYFGSSGRIPVLVAGRWWTFLTASWLHASAIHIFMNMWAVRNVAPIVAEFFGASRMIIIYVISGVVGFAASTFGGTYLAVVPFLAGGSFTVGASASIAGLIGAVFFYGHRTGSSGIAQQAKMWIMMFLLFGFLVRGIDNWAHLGGLAAGYLCAKFLDPLYPERLDHFLIALGLLALTAVAIVVSFIHAHQLLSLN
jgi:membrane associated rhomboid family serine protease